MFGFVEQTSPYDSGSYALSVQQFGAKIDDRIMFGCVTAARRSRNLAPYTDRHSFHGADMIFAL